MTNAEARFNKSLRPRKPEGSLGRTAQDVHLDSHTAPELCVAAQTGEREGNTTLLSLFGFVFFFFFFGLVCWFGLLDGCFGCCWGFVCLLLLGVAFDCFYLLQYCLYVC